ncbi:hypothetical protein X975_15517, partial [Stegodyphus mimosarum]
MAEMVISDMDEIVQEEEGVLDKIKDLKQMVETLKNTMQVCLYQIEVRLDNICQTYEEEIKSYPAENVQEAVEDTLNERTLRDETLSEVAENIIKQKIGGPLSPDAFREFLLHRAWGKPKPPVLPLVRHYTFDIAALKEQLKALRNELNQHHKNYMEGRKLDVNLNSRINRLLNNIDKELSEE